MVSLFFGLLFGGRILLKFHEEITLSVETNSLRIDVGDHLSLICGISVVGKIDNKRKLINSSVDVVLLNINTN